MLYCRHSRTAENTGWCLQGQRRGSAQTDKTRSVPGHQANKAWVLKESQWLLRLLKRFSANVARHPSHHYKASPLCQKRFNNSTPGLRLKTRSQHRKPPLARQTSAVPVHDVRQGLAKVTPQAAAPDNILSSQPVLISWLTSSTSPWTSGSQSFYIIPHMAEILSPRRIQWILPNNFHFKQLFVTFVTRLLHSSAALLHKNNKLNRMWTSPNMEK